MTLYGFAKSYLPAVFYQKIVVKLYRFLEQCYIHDTQYPCIGVSFLKFWIYMLNRWRSRLWFFQSHLTQGRATVGHRENESIRKVDEFSVLASMSFDSERVVNINRRNLLCWIYGPMWCHLRANAWEVTRGVCWPNAIPYSAYVWSLDRIMISYYSISVILQ